MRRTNDRTNSKVNTCNSYSWIAELIVIDKTMAGQSYQSVQWLLWASGNKKFKFSWKYTEKKSLKRPLPHFVASELHELWRHLYLVSQEVMMNHSCPPGWLFFHTFWNLCPLSTVLHLVLVNWTALKVLTHPLNPMGLPGNCSCLLLFSNDGEAQDNEREIIFYFYYLIPSVKEASHS